MAEREERLRIGADAEITPWAEFLVYSTMIWQGAGRIIRVHWHSRSFWASGSFSAPPQLLPWPAVQP